MPHKTDLIDLSDELTKHLCQAQAMIVCISDDDRLAALETATVVNVLWAISDRLADIDRLHSEIVDAERTLQDARA